MMRFRARIELHGTTATGIVVPPEVVESLQSGKRPAVRVTINGHTHRSTVAPMAGEFRLPLSAEHRASSGDHQVPQVSSCRPSGLELEMAVD